MDRYQAFKKELIQIKQSVFNLILEAKSLPGVTDESFKSWEKVCETFEDEVSKDIVRIAVVGPIKSGKSTFVNSLFKKDYLKRGAGVVTSIVTRIRKGKTLRAKLYFKSWKEVNSDLEQALILFPSPSRRSENGAFDIRHPKDRRELRQALRELTPEQLITEDSRNAGSVLLTSYLKGYEYIKRFVAVENRIHKFNKKMFPEHKKFTGDDSMAVYLKDIQLEIDTAGMEDPVEIADCQGSDSPNPLHVAMIQDYLLLTHFIIYVISSRTGLRQADIKFLSMIKRIGIVKNILFVINCDISEHESMSDLNALIQKIKSELSLIIRNPDIYAFSSLFNLFKFQEDVLSPKDRQRIEQWNFQKELVAFSDDETNRFESIFYRKLTREKSSLLIRNHLERLGAVNQKIEDWLCINQDVFSREEDSIKEVIEKTKLHQEKLQQIERVVKNSIDGAVPKIKSILKKEIDHFFDIRPGTTLEGVIEFIRSYTLANKQYEEILKNSGFSNTLYAVFQDIKNAIDMFMAVNINPEIIRFVAEIEDQIRKSLEDVAGPYESLAQDTLHEYIDSMAAIGIDLNKNRLEPVCLNNIGSIKAIAGIHLPPLAAGMHYTAGIRSEAIARLGFYSALKLLKKLLKKPIQREKEEEMFALGDSIRRIKQETEKSVIAHFKDYRENVKFQYVFKLVDALANKLCLALLDRLKIYTSDLSVVIDLILNKQIDKEKSLDIINSMALRSRATNDQIQGLRKRLK